MRIPSITPSWPALVVAAACVSRVMAADTEDGGTEQNPHEDIITFDDKTFVTDANSEAAVWSTPDGEVVENTFTFTIKSSSSVTVSDAWLIGEGANYITRVSPNNTRTGPPVMAASDVAGGVKATSPRDNDNLMQLQMSDNSGSIYFPNLGLIGNATMGGFGQALHFKLRWNNSGESYSRQFTVTDFREGTVEYKRLQEEFNDPKVFSEQVLPSSISGTQTPSMGGAASSTSGAVISTGTITAGAGSSASSNPMSSNNGKGGGGGLSTGAIAGIAVACGVIGLALIGFAIWFFCFRRRNGDGVSAAPYGSDRHHRTQELIAEKEANAGVTESPHSPYSDDGQQQHQHVVGMNGSSIPMDQPVSGRDSSHFVSATAPIMAPSPHPQSIERSYTPYSDHRGSGIIGTPETQQSQPVHYDQPERGAPSPQVTSQPTAAATAARSVSPQGGTGGRYAHLVEEGMTEDEIRRLEEEERQLDAAIADREAGRGR